MNLNPQHTLTTFKTDDGRSIAFHGDKFEFAEVSAQADAYLSSTTFDRPPNLQQYNLDSAALEELAKWAAETASADHPLTSALIQSVTLNVTQICNLHCTYCAAGGDGTYGDPLKKISIEKVLPQIKFLIEKIKAGQGFHVSFIGGEPLLYPEAIKMIGEYVLELAKPLALQVSFKITTNGTLLTPAVIELLAPLRAQLIVSMDGPEAVHDLQRKKKTGAGSFADVQAGLLVALARRKAFQSIGVHAVFAAPEIHLVEAWRYFQTLSIDHMEFTLSVESHHELAVNKFITQMHEVARLAWVAGEMQALRRINNFRQLFERLDSREPLRNHCGINRSLVIMDSRGQGWNCPWTVGLKDHKINIEDYGPDKKAPASLIELNQCQKCWAKGLCGGGCSFIHKTTSDPRRLEKNTAYCKLVREFALLALTYYFKQNYTEIPFQNSERTLQHDANE